VLELLAAVVGLAARREDLDDQGRVEQGVVVLVFQEWLATHPDGIGIGIEPGGGNVDPQIAGEDLAGPPLELLSELSEQVGDDGVVRETRAKRPETIGEHLAVQILAPGLGAALDLQVLLRGHTSLHSLAISQRSQLHERRVRLEAGEHDVDAGFLHLLAAHVLELLVGVEVALQEGEGLVAFADLGPDGGQVVGGGEDRLVLAGDLGGLFGLAELDQEGGGEDLGVFVLRRDGERVLDVAVSLVGLALGAPVDRQVAVGERQRIGAQRILEHSEALGEVAGVDRHLAEAVQRHRAGERIGVHRQDLLEGLVCLPPVADVVAVQLAQVAQRDRIARIGPSRFVVILLRVGEVQLVFSREALGEGGQDRLLGRRAPVRFRKSETFLVRHGLAELLELLGGFLRGLLGEAALLPDLGIEGDGAVLVPMVRLGAGGVEEAVGVLFAPLDAVLHHLLDLVLAERPAVLALHPRHLGAVGGEHQHGDGGVRGDLVLLPQLGVVGPYHPERHTLGRSQRQGARVLQLGALLVARRGGEPVEDEDAGGSRLAGRDCFPGHAIELLLRAHPPRVHRRVPRHRRNATHATASTAATGGEDRRCQEEEGEAEQELFHACTLPEPVGSQLRLRRPSRAARGCSSAHRASSFSAGVTCGNCGSRRKAEA